MLVSSVGRSAARPHGIDFPQAAQDYVDDVATAKKEPSDEHGIVYLEDADGSWCTLKTSGQTTPDGRDIPDRAVKNNRVVISVDGIHQSFAKHRQQIESLLESSRPHGYGANVGQPVVGIHEGVGRNILADLWRIEIDRDCLSALEGHALPVSRIHRVAYHEDPAVKAVYDEVRQSLEQHRDVQLVVHSGGGAETALALTLLSREGFQDAVRQHVRVAALAPAASRKDFEKAGLKAENIFYSGSKRDPVWRLCHHYVPSWLAFMHVPIALSSLYELAHQHNFQYHSPDYIFARNVLPDGSSRIQRFLDGGRGGEYTLP
ncbi:MAG: hypothetical protein ACYCW6_00620 [Candidatus Xenobia bacterium]